MSDVPQGDGWWLASDGRYYPPESAPPPTPSPPTPSPSSPPPFEPVGGPAPVAPPAAGASAVPPFGAPTTTGPPTSESSGSSGSSGYRPLLLAAAGLAAVVVLIVAAVVVVRWRAAGTALTANAVGPSGPDVAPDRDLQLADDAVVVQGNGGATLKAVGGDGTHVTIASGAPGADKLAPGSVMVLTGMMVGKVTSVDRSGDDTVVGLGPAAISDVVKDGSLTWDHQPVDFSKASLRVWEPKAPPAKKSSLPSFAPAGVAGPAAPLLDIPLAVLAQSATTSGQVGDYHYEFTPRVAGDQVKFDLTLTRDAGGFVISVESHVEVASMSLSGNTAVSDGRTGGFSLDADNLTGHAKVSATASTGRSHGPNTITGLELPMSIDVPFVVAGIPFTVGIGGSISVEPSFTSNDATVTGEVDVRYSGRAGLSIASTSLTGTGAFDPDSTDPQDVLAGVGLTPVAVIVKVSFPKLNFGLGFAAASAGASLDMTYSFGPSFSGSTNIVPCAAQPENLKVTAGLSATFLGHEIDVASAEVYNRNWDYLVPAIQGCRTG